MLSHESAITIRLPDHASSWFRSPQGRRYGRHFFWLIALKVALLTALYFVFIKPQPRVDTSPDHVYAAIRGTPAAAASSSQSTDSQTPREPMP